MAIAAKLLADGACASSLTTVYTAPGATTALVKTITIRNKNATAESVVIAINGTGTDREVCAAVLLSGETLVFSEPLVLLTGDLLKLSATTASGVHYTVSGAEVT